MNYQVSLIGEQAVALRAKVHALMYADAEDLQNALRVPIEPDEIGECEQRLRADFALLNELDWAERRDGPDLILSTLDKPDELAAIASRILLDATENTREHLDLRLACKGILEQVGEPVAA